MQHLIEFQEIRRGKRKETEAPSDEELDRGAQTRKCAIILPQNLKMATTWRIRKRSLRPRGQHPPEDHYRMDQKKSPQENAQEIYSGLSNRETSETKRLSYLNAMATLLLQLKDVNLGFSTEEFLYCLSSSLTHHFTQVRAASLRAIRHLLVTSKDIQLFNALQLPFLVCRSIDLVLRNEEERVQALKLIRKMLAVSPDVISPAIVRCLISLAESGAEDNDRMLRACLATLCEFGVLNSTLLIICGGVSAITRNVLECHSPRIAESLCGVLLHFLEWPHTRNIAGVRLDCLAAPYCDFTYRLGIMDKNKDARELRYTCSRLALLSVLRSWTGTIEFCDPNKPSGLKAIVDILYLNQTEVRKAILDLLYELLGLPQPIWTDEYSVALAAVDPSDFQDAWRLSDGFVAMEGRCILPSLANRVPNICEQHLALLLYCFLETGLLNALIEVIVSSDTFLSVRATVLIGKLLQLMHTHLPADICSISPALPTLISHATQGNNQALAAISALQNLHQILKNRPASCSLFLDSIIQGGSLINSRLFKREINTQENLNILPPLLGNIERRRHDSVSSSTSGGEETTSLPTNTSKRASLRSRRKKLFHFFESLKEIERLIKDSNVLLNQDGNTWDWEIIIAILRSDAIGKLDDTKCRFVRKVVHYFKPSSNRFSHQDLSHGRHLPAYVTAGLDLIDWLLQSPELECMRLLTDLFSDISGQLLAISTSRSAHDCLFSPQHMSSTMCQQYFLFMGRMCRYEKGLSILTNTDVFKQIQNLVISTNHVCYIKLIVSGLDYGLEAYPRKILEKSLTMSKLRDGRLYATQFMLVLLRAKIPNFEVWGLPLLINQTKDSERSVVLAAMEILDEACHDRTYLEEIVSIWYDFKPLGDVGKLLMTRYYSIPRGLNHQNAQVAGEIDVWKNGYNKRYVLLMEADTHASLTLHTKNEDGFYSRRTCSSRPIMIPPNIPPHLYGQLIQTEQGSKLLKKHGDISRYVEILNMAKCSDENESLELKAALWTLGHISTNGDGVEYLNDPVSRVYEKIIFLAKYCEVYSLRATALSVLGLIGTSNAGANVLFKLDWFCVRHDRNTLWPVCEPEDWLSNNLTPVRHQYEEMPPYNYTGIDENINGFNTSSDSNSFYFDENVESKDSSKDECDGQIGTAARSRTLPESNTTRFIKHTRSLSESKTTDVISLITGVPHNRTRFNSGTDSNTSGVSSCESVFGRNILGEMTQTPLSPIPSTSNLLELPSTKGRFRRISLVGTQYRESSISPQDIQGYATLRSLRRHCRPVLSESAADELAEIIDPDQSLPLRSRKLSMNESQRKIKVRSLDRHTTQLIPRIEEFQVPLPTLKTPKFLSQNETKGPLYSGICLPKNILDLFPARTKVRTYVSRDIQDLDIMDANLLIIKPQFLNDSLNEGDESSVSSLSDVSSVSKRSKWVGKHNRTSCLHCSRSRVNRLHPRTDSDINIFKRKSNYSSSVQLSDISFNSPESILSDESMPDRVTANILYHVQRMANPVSGKPAKKALLELKQKHASSFQDICLYSEVCKSLGRNTYLMNARRFLQELFLDLNFDSFYVEPIEILNRKEKDISSSACSNSEDELKDLEILGFSGMIGSQMQNDILSSVGYICSSSSGSNIGTSAHKTHLKSPPLASVYETSYENLSDSFNSKTKIPSMLGGFGPNSTTKIHQQLTSSNNKLIKSNNNSNINNKNTNNNGSNSSSACDDSIDGKPIENENKKYTRGRFYTLELDLSCTKNKFPITDRRKKDFSPTLSTSGSIFPQLTFTKSLASSIAAPTGSLYCEKRLHSSKSEAVLSKTKQN